MCGMDLPVTNFDKTLQSELIVKSFDPLIITMNVCGIDNIGIAGGLSQKFSKCSNTEKCLSFPTEIA